MGPKLSTNPHQTSQLLIGLEQATTPKTLQAIRCWGWRHDVYIDWGRVVVQAVIRLPLNGSTRVPSRDFVFWRTKWHLVVYRFPLLLSVHQYLCSSLKLLLTEVQTAQSCVPPNKNCALQKIGEFEGIKICHFFFSADFCILTPYC